jgi:peptide/nickel transport system ATP-binding protein
MLAVQGLAKHYQAASIKDVSFELARGELLLLEGASGSGKTTVLHCIARLIEPDAGTVVYAGQDVTHVRGAALTDYRRRVRLVFQHPSSALDPRFTAVESIAEPLIVTGTPAGDAERLAREALERVGLSQELATRRAPELSGGERQRVGLARALVGTPELILADEPVSALDEAARDEALKLLLTLQRQLAFSCVLVSHAPIVEGRRVRL